MGAGPGHYRDGARALPVWGQGATGTGLGHGQRRGPGTAWGQGTGTAGTGTGLGQGTGAQPAWPHSGHPRGPAPRPRPRVGAMRKPQDSDTGARPHRRGAASRSGALPAPPSSRVSAEAVPRGQRCPQRTLSLQVPLRLRGRPRSSRRADRSRRRDEVELRSPQLRRWMPSWRCSAPGQALQGTCNPMETGCGTACPPYGTTPTAGGDVCALGEACMLQQGGWRQADALGRMAGVAGDGRGMHDTHTLSLRTDLFPSRLPGLRKASRVPQGRANPRKQEKDHYAPQLGSQGWDFTAASSRLQ